MSEREKGEDKRVSEKETERKREGERGRRRHNSSMRRDRK